MNVVPNYLQITYRNHSRVDFQTSSLYVILLL